MAATVKAKYDSSKTVESVLFDLIGIGMSHDNIEKNDETHEITVTTSKDSKAQIEDILKRHQPEKMG